MCLDYYLAVIHHFQAGYSHRNVRVPVGPPSQADSGRGAQAGSRGFRVPLVSLGHMQGERPSPCGAEMHQEECRQEGRAGA